MHAIAKPDLKIMLQACGHRMGMHRCKVFLPAWDDVLDDDLPREAKAPLQLFPTRAAGASSASGLVRGDWTGPGNATRQIDDTPRQASDQRPTNPRSTNPS